MKAKAALLKLSNLLKKPSFTSQDASKVGVSSATLSYYVNTGYLSRIDRGVYRGTNSPSIDDFRWEDLIIKMSKIENGVICLTTALSIYDLTEEMPRKHWIAVAHKTRHRANKSTKIVRMRNIELGKITIKINHANLHIFDKERTIVDAFRFLSMETAIKALRKGLSLSGKEKISIEKLNKYAKILRVNIKPYLIGLTT